MAEGEGTDAIDAAIQSAESLLGSLLRPPPASPLNKQPPLQSGSEETESPLGVDVEESLFPGQPAPLSPAHHNNLPIATTSTSATSTPRHDATMTSLSLPELGGIPSQTSSLLSLHGSGVAGGPPGQLTAGAHAAVEPLIVEEVQSLHALSSRTSIGSITPPPDYDTVYRILTEREKDLELAARIGRSLLQRNELLETELGSQLDHRQQLEQQLAQLRHALGQKEGLLRLYAQDANEVGDEGAGEGEGKQGDWIKALTEECRHLRDSNLKLTAEADRLQLATAEVEEKERRLVTQCLEQFAEARSRLSELREREELTSSRNMELQAKLEGLEEGFREEVLSRQQLEAENESLREQLTEAHETTAQLTSHVADLQDKWEECSVHLKEAQDEIQSLKESSIHSSPQTQNGDEAAGATDHESIVQEIEEALRKEIIAASTLTERPSSPKQYALQRTQAVMATVRAATQAMARRQERLAAAHPPPPPPSTAHPSDSAYHSTSRPSPRPPTISTPLHPFNPIATSSPEGPLSSSTGFSIGVGTSGLNSSHLAPHAAPLSPTASEAGSTLSLPDEASWLRHQYYVAPEKLQIVKPLEGSVTLLKWKLMASPQLGGATSFFSDASRPGVHIKGWKAAGIKDKEQGSLGLPPELRLKSLSTNDLTYLTTSPPPSSHPPHTPSSSFSTSSHRHRRGQRRAKGIHSRLSNPTASSAIADGNGINTLPEGTRSHDQSDDQALKSRDQNGGEQGGRRGSQGKGNKGEGEEEGNTSLLKQVGNLFSWSTLGLGGGSKKSGSDRDSHTTGDVNGTESVDSPDRGAASADVGLAGIL